jgi:parallel beta-helix repeat protein
MWQTLITLWLSLVRPGPRRAPPRPAFRRPLLEALEDRTVPSTLTVTNNLDSGDGSLRADIAAAQSGDTIVFNSSGSSSLKGQTITLTSGELLVSKSLTIQGLGAGQLTVSGDSLSRVFEVQAGATVSLSGLTITNGSDSDGGGIFNAGTLTLTGCTISGNTASSNGGGIYNHAGTLTLSGCTISGNTAGLSILGGEGGGIWSNGWMTLTDCALTGNSVGIVTGIGGQGYGGAIFNTGTGAGFLTITSCTITGNTSTSFGGGIFNDAFAHLTLKHSTVTGNSEADLALSVYGYASLHTSHVGLVQHIS